MEAHSLHNAIATVPPGKWAVGVSGGADSVALLLLLHERRDLSIHAVHLNHQTRGEENAVDAQFVGDLAARLHIGCTIACRDEIEKTTPEIPPNPSMRYRLARMALFRNVVDEHTLRGVILAHHADDLAETVMQRLLRGSGVRGLVGMTARRRVGGLLILRPLLEIKSRLIREFLTTRRQEWREDPSNQSDKYSRNRVRKWLADRNDLSMRLCALSSASDEYRTWLSRASVDLNESFRCNQLDRLPTPLARESIRRWLMRAGSSAADLNVAALDRCIEMARDAASAARQDFPGNLTVRRRGGMMSSEPQGS